MTDTLPDRIRLPLDFDAAALRADLDMLSCDTWIDHFVRDNYEGEWTVLPLRGAAGASHPVMLIYPDPTARAFEDGPLMQRVPYIREALGRLSCPLQCVRLMRLSPGSAIKPHRDYDLDLDSGGVRLHVPITTSPEVEFLLNGTPVVMTPGSVWYLRLSDRHSVANRGTSDRVHLVIDAEPNDWLRGVLFAACT